MKAIVGYPAALLIPLLAQPPAAMGQGGNGDWRDRLARELPAQSKRYLEGLERYQLDAEATSFDRIANRLVGRNRAEYRQNGDCGLFSYVGVTGEPNQFQADRLSAVNSRYSFTLKRKVGRSGWAIIELEQHTSDRPQAEAEMAGRRLRQSMSPYNIGRSWLPGLVTAPGFAVDKVEPARPGGLVRFDFSCPFPGEEVSRRSGFFVTDPENYWIVHEFELAEHFPKSVLFTAGKKEYVWEDKFPLLSRIVVQKRSSLPEMREGTVDTYVLKFFKQEVPEEEFTLTAFGLPEPFGVEPIRRRWYTRWYVIVGGLGGLCLIGGAALRRRGQRAGQPG